LERYREFVPSWGAQRQALQCVVQRKEQAVKQKQREVEALVAEKEQTDRLYAQRYDALCRGLAEERDKAQAHSESVHRDLERSLQDEAVATQALSAEDKRHAKLKASYDQTVAQLESVNTSAEKCKTILEEANPPEPDVTPELVASMRQMEDTLKARDQIRSQARTIRAEVMLAQDELQRQRAYSSRMEEFVRRVSSGGGRYTVHPADKREANRLLFAASKLRTAAGLSAFDEIEE